MSNLVYGMRMAWLIRREPLHFRRGIGCRKPVFKDHFL
jgi:hypothetical protein